MDVMSYIMRTTGKNYPEVAKFVRLEANVRGVIRVVSWDAAGLGMPQPSADDLAAWQDAPEYVDLDGYAANLRWQKEVGGIVVAGIPIATDDRSKQMIIGARIAADANPNFTTSWVGSDGAIYPLTAAQVIDVSDAVLAHVQSCFATYATVAQAIKTDNMTTTEQVDAAFAAI